MPGPDHKATHHPRPGVLLQVAVIAWLSIMVMPCTAFAAGTPAMTGSPATTQVDCHGAHGVVEAAQPECCCDPLAIAGSEAAKSQRLDVFITVLAAPLPMPAVAHFTSIEIAHPPPLSTALPPIYLTTQRLRI